ncbi:protein EPIDERMAL PATTERNING FACTOR 1-like [Momordica charantia]|uniref:Epidermal patterning factor-like protein n=1 Tax=Momordica charantia TaxID=3673 RepID=A0A6J1CGD5_MOMCH|nr:protein EPIDERMAL PATTERNING FACTOR 1-like [Momordica charantia]
MKSMKRASIDHVVVVLVIVGLLVQTVTSARHITRSGKGIRRGETVKIAGSRLPDCSHACGWCSPCRLVMVRYICGAAVEDSETCPTAYKCMCTFKSFPVP